MDLTEKFSPLPWNDYFDENYLLKVNSNENSSKSEIIIPTENLQNSQNNKNGNCEAEILNQDSNIDLKSKANENSENKNVQQINVYYTKETESTSSTCFFFIHGAGMTALSFALLAKELKNSFPCIAFDVRGHGKTTLRPFYQLSIENLVEDTKIVFDAFASKYEKVIVVGHSLGGAIAVNFASKYEKTLKILGVIVIDVVEGPALQSLPIMKAILQRIPNNFQTENRAIRWDFESSPYRSLEASRVILPSRMQPEEEGVSWRTNLYATEPYWRTWFTGMTDKFLGLRKAAKLMIVADADRLDKSTTIAQMQGKFQLEVVDRAGHEIHENRPKIVASIFKRFAVRNKF